jgi:hypothetical protein
MLKIECDHDVPNNDDENKKIWDEDPVIEAVAKTLKLECN